MDYKNLLHRSFFALILFFLYLVSLNNNGMIFILAIVIYAIIFFECFLFFKVYLYFTITYIFLSLICFSIYYFNFFELYFFNILLSVIIIFDSFSYFTGLIFGKTKIFIKISPKKTLEGYLGGVIFTNLILSTFILSTLEFSEIKPLLIFINCIIFFAIFGDLIQSFFKRKNNIKNSSFYLPGHGGFFDRFDSFLPSIIFLLFYSL